jgi:hypothetical protein
MAMVEAVIIICLLVGIGAVAVTLACCKVSAKVEAQEDPCDSCLRWSECNGVDGECPWRAQ